LKKAQLLGCLLLLSLFLKAQSTFIDLTGQWEMKASYDSGWQTAFVPGNVYIDLEHQGRINNPLTGINEKSTQWVDTASWLYRLTFEHHPTKNRKNEVFLVFDGIDTRADIYLNGKLLGKADNMFRSWEFEVADVLKKGRNELLLYFYPIIPTAQLAAKNYPFPLPGGDAPFARKAQYQFGWDWAPRLAGCGIWKNVRLEFREPLYLTQPFIRTQSLDSERATVQISGSVHGSQNVDWELETRLFDGNKWLVERRKKLNSIAGAAYSTLIEIPQPELWWPNGHGKARLYPVEVNLYVGERLIDQKRFKTGLRTIQWVQQADSIGASFQLQVNGKPIFVKGANWVPPDQFPARITSEKYRQQVQMAADANLNMLRIWGGGTYADEAFLDACDSLGILVWQDFMFACALYPTDQAFLNTVRQEATQQIDRMRNRTSLALWCGNNEISEGWFNWGWQKSLAYTYADSIELYRQYAQLFEELLPELVNQHHPGAFYHPSSPSNGWGRDTAYKSGDVHYWGVWWGFAPFESYREKTGRFVSEYGFQGYPTAKTRQLMTSGLPSDSTAQGLAAHQKHPIGDSTIRVYMARDYPVPIDPEKFAYVSQILQARGMQIAMESHRFAQPYCMGSLFWQWNDCWPAISWSAIDYLDAPKAFYYQAKRSFAPDVFRVDTTADSFIFEWISDTHVLEKGTRLRIQLGTTAGLLHLDTVILLDDPSIQSGQFTFPKSHLSEKIDRNKLYVRSMLLSGQLEASWSTPLYFVAPKNLALQTANISWAIKSPNLLVVETDKLVKDLEILAPGLELADNFFDLLPGEAKEIPFKRTTAGPRSPISFRSLIDCF